MIEDIELLNHIHQNADMGRDSISHVISLSDDRNFISTLESQRKEYDKTCEVSSKLIERFGQDKMSIDNAKPLEKAVSFISTNIQTITDHSPSKLANLVIKGNTMGITNLTKQVNEYVGNENDVIKLAKKQIKLEEKNIEEMKKFL